MTGLCTQCNPDIIGQMGWDGLASVGVIRAPAFVPESVGTFLLESAWLYWIALLAISLSAIYVGRSRGQRAAVRAGVVLAVATVLWIGLAILVDTPTERLDAAHRAVLSAAERKDVPAILAHLASGFRSEALHIAPSANAGDEIDRLLKAYGIRSTHVQSLKVVMHYPDAATTVGILTTIDTIGPVATTWDLDWVDEAGTDWKITGARLVRIGTDPAPEGAIPK